MQKMDKLEDEPLEIQMFFNSLKSKMTVKVYKSYFKKYLKMTGLDINSLIAEKDPRKIELQIIKFINKMKDEGKNQRSPSLILGLLNVTLLSQR